MDANRFGGFLVVRVGGTVTPFGWPDSNGDSDWVTVYGGTDSAKPNPHTGR